MTQNLNLNKILFLIQKVNYRIYIFQKYLRNKPQFVKITKAGFYESMVHNVDVVKSDSKY